MADFNVRVNALEYQNFQDKISGSIENVQNLQIFRTVSERFVEVSIKSVLTHNTEIET